MFTNYRTGLGAPPAPYGIVFDNRLFTEPEPLPATSGLAAFLNSEGVYVILTDDPTASPRPYRALYFGESGTLWGRATSAHENYSSWQRAAGPYVRLYRAFHVMPGSTQRDRQVAESSLITAYNPPCNQKLSFDFGGLFGLGGYRG
jgi:hypothetical protein